MSNSRRRSTPRSLSRLPLLLAVTLALLAFAGCVDAPPPTPTAIATIEAPAPQPESPTPVPTEEETPEAEASDAEVAEEDAADAESADAESADTESADTESADADSADADSADAESADAESADAESADAESADDESADDESADDESADDESADADSADAESADDETSTVDASAFNTWNVTELYDLDTLGGVTVTVQLLSDAELTGWTGCNEFAAAYTAGDGAFELIDLFLTSENECSSETETAQELLFQEALTNARTYELSGAELTLSDATGAPVAVLRNAVTLELVGTTWNVTGYRDSAGSFVPPVEDSPVLNLVLRQDAVSGFSGCANFEGTAEVSGDAIAIDNLSYDVVGLGTQECEGSSPLSNQDAEYRKTLTTAATWQIDGPNMTLSDEAGEPVVAYLAAGAEQSFLE